MLLSANNLVAIETFLQNSRIAFYLEGQKENHLPIFVLLCGLVIDISDTSGIKAETVLRRPLFLCTRHAKE